MRVLVVEDEVDLAEAIADGLASYGFAVDVTHDGLDGLWRASEHDYGAIVLDLLLPGMNGYRVCRTLRDQGVATPILMLTAKTGEYDEAEALDTGADDFLSKPFSFVVLVARRGPARPDRELSCGDLALDPHDHTCRRGGHPIELSAREHALLEALIRQPGRAVPKWTLVREVWGDDFTGDANIVEVYIGYLRRKIDTPFGRRSLRTVRGVGYRLVPDA